MPQVENELPKPISIQCGKTFLSIHEINDVVPNRIHGQASLPERPFYNQQRIDKADER
jgi:hypothetical protein